MKVIVQRVKEASCTVENNITGQIENGYMLLVGFGLDDTRSIVEKVACKIAKLRIFDDENGKINKSIFDVDGKVLSISQFTLYADIKGGNRPAFINALKGEEAKELYKYFNECLRGQGLQVEEGIFGADMKIALINDGPCTIIVDSKELNHD